MTFFRLAILICFLALVVTCALDGIHGENSSENRSWFGSRARQVSRELDENPVLDQLSELRDRIEEILDDLAKLKLSMFLNQNKENVFESRMEKCSKELSQGNELIAMKYWEDIQIHLATHEQAKLIAAEVIEGVNLKIRKNVLSLIHFARYMNVPQAYDTLLARMKSEKYFFRSPEIFILANDIKNACGVSQPVFKDLPKVLRDVAGSVVNLKNSYTNGYLYYQSTPETFFTWFSSHKHRNYFEQLDESKKPRCQWEFLVYGDKIRIVNSYNGNILVDPKALFSIEMMNEEEIRLRVDQASNKDHVGKYLVAKPRNKGEQFSLIAFLDENSATTPDQLKWKTEALRPRILPDKMQRC